MLTIESGDGCFMLVDDGVGLCSSKSRNVLVRVRDALNAVRGTSLVGMTVESGNSKKFRGVVLAVSGHFLIVRLATGMLNSWNVDDCRIVEPVRDKPTVSGISEPGDRGGWEP